MIQNSEDMVRSFCAYGLEFKDCDGFNHDFFTLLPALELEYKTSIHSSTNKTTAVLEKGWNPRLPQDSLRKDLVELHPTASSFKFMLDKARKHAVRCMKDSFAYAKDKWDKSHATPDFKVGDLVLVYTTNFNKSKGCKRLQESFSRPFIIKALHGEILWKCNCLRSLVTRILHITKPYKSGDAEKSPLRNNVPSIYLLLNHLVLRKSPKFSKKGN
ncbi:hypothetical protein O181_114557 [Austropuccinia psidii MF-1]|uniref:Uncharacterized protein n=1 Tax=Austropuccinia psidii MF-1 TaxID=1389203 RepID=A0A9Q3K5T5_9BASI|nr:hypothetical protein [Austropuccinia psidii MF-1]